MRTTATIHTTQPGDAWAWIPDAPAHADERDDHADRTFNLVVPILLVSTLLGAGGMVAVILWIVGVMP